MKILHIITSSVCWAGMEQYAFDLSKGLIARGYEHVFVIANDGDKVYPRFMEIGKVYLLPLKSKFDVASILGLRKILKSEKPDIIHTHQPKNIFHAYFAQNIKRSTPIVHTIHFNIGRTSPHKLYSWILNRPTVIIPVSNLVRCSAIALYPNINPNKFHTILNSIDTSRISNTITEPHKGVELGYAGRLVEYKGVETLLNAVAILKSKNIDFKLALAGKGNEAYEEILRKIVKENNIEENVAFLGFVSDMSRFISDIDIAVSPSICAEACSLTVLEYMAKGKAIITSDNGGQLEVIDNNVEGILITPSDSALLAEKLELLINNSELRNSLGKAAKERFDNELSFSLFLDRTLALYQSILETKTP